MACITLRTRFSSPRALLLALFVFVLQGCGGGGGGSTPTPTTATEPIPSIAYPQAKLYSDGSAITVRGSTTIEIGSISSVTVNGVNANSADNFATWSVEVPLTIGLNTLSVVATNNAGSTNSSAVEIDIVREEYTLERSRSIIHDTANNRVLLVARPFFSENAIMAVDLSSGAQTVLSTEDQTTSGSSLRFPGSITVDAVRQRAFIITGGNIETINLATGDRAIFSIASLPGDVAVSSINSISFDNTNDRLLMVALSEKEIISVDPVTGVPTIIVDTIDTNEPISLPSIKSIRIDEANNRALILKNGQPKGIVSVDLNTGDRTILSDRNTPNAENLFGLGNSANLAVDSANNIAYVADGNAGLIYKVDLATGARSIFLDRTSSNSLIEEPVDLFYEESKNRLVVFDDGNNILLQVDLATNELSLISKVHNSNTNIYSAEINSLAYDASGNRLLSNSFRGGRVGRTHVISVDSELSEISQLATAPYISNSTFQGIALDSENNILYFEEGFSDAVFAYDLETEDVSLISSPGHPNYTNIPGNLTSVKFDSANNRLVALDLSSAALYAIDIAAGARTLISDNGTPNAVNPMSGPFTMDEDFANNRVFVVDYIAESLFEVNTITGERTLISGPTTPDTVNPFDFLRAVAYDSGNSRFYVADSGVKAIIVVDAATGARTILSDNTTPDTNNPFSTPSGIQLDLSNNRILVSDRGTDQLLAVDLTTGARTELFTVDSPERFVFDSVNNRAIVSASSPSGLFMYDFGTSFLSSIEPEETSYSFDYMTVDDENNQVFALDGGIFSIDLSSHEVTPIESSALNSIDVRRIAYDGLNERLLVSSTEAIYTFDPVSGSVEVLSDESYPDTELPFSNMRDIAVDESSNRVIASESFSSEASLISVDLDTGERSILSSNTIPDDVIPFMDAEHLVIDSGNNRALVLDGERAAIIAVDLVSGSRTIISAPSTPNAFNLFDGGEGEVKEMVLDTVSNSVVLSFDASPRLLIIDLLTGQRAYLTR